MPIAAHQPIFDDLLGSESPLDRPIIITTFSDPLACSKVEHETTLRQLINNVHDRTATTKGGLPLLKIGRFGSIKTDKGSLRSNGNLVSIDGIEGDYDGGLVSVSVAADRLRKAGVAAGLYSSPSHTADKPRWRVVCPLDAATEPSQRDELCARLNGALGGILSSESFALSQSYYFGRIAGGVEPETAIVEGRPLDLLFELKNSAIGRDGKSYRAIDLPAPANEVDDDDWEWQPAPDWDRIAAALAFIPVQDADQQDTGGREMWLRIGQALHHVSSGSDEGFSRWDEWSRGGQKYDARHIQRDWKSFGKRDGKRVRIGTLYDFAKRYGWSENGAVAPDEIDSIGADTVKPPQPTSALRFLAPSDCSETPSRGYVVKGLLAPRDLACIFGAPGAGKSLISPHLGYLASQGLPVFGMRTKPARVFYVAAEDPHGMRGRVTGLRIRHGDAPDFLLVEGVSDLLAKDSPDLAALRSAVSEQKPALIFLDTLAMSFPGLEENTADDMGRVVAIGRSLTKHGAAVVLIHHDTKAQGATPRGHSLLNGALDVGLQLFPRDELGIVRAKLTKNRNGACDRDIAFRIGVEMLGEDEDGDPITAALVEELKPGSVPKRDRPTPSEQAALRIFLDLVANGSVTESAWRAACIDGLTVSGSDNRESRSKATKRAIEGLARKGAVLLLGDGFVRRPDSVGSAFDEDG